MINKHAKLVSCKIFVGIHSKAVIDMNETYSDQINRELALDPQQSFIIQAPAGSGKTELLTQRFLSLLITVSKPEEIVAITFTRKAAAEMRHRIIKALSHAELNRNTNLTELPTHQQTTFQLATRALQHDHENAWHILQNPNRLRIFTIDSLASRISSQMPVLAGLGGTPELCENAERYYQQAVIALLQLFNECGQSHEKNESKKLTIPTKWQQGLNQLLLHMDNRISQVETLLIDMLKSREQWLPYLIHWQLEQSESAESTDQKKLRAHLEQSLTQLIHEQLNYVSMNLPVLGSQN